ncbi:hypothetical protein SAMN04515671_1247 [Nakamurella panacisegetis]|uniref:Dolichyl-phosphate-mannose-protein mannosyltransferase n=2 Tax=Nakamurella panacisegetis TaxID=1090615 RepID=A0A1H0KC21_9ACTN|nr:hypothetical protein SAMN04515671_1247 [Nakamurella panacisegetis]
MAGSDRVTPDASAASWYRRPWARTWGLGAFVFLVHTFSPTPQSADSRLSTITAWQFFHHFNLHLDGYRVVAELTYRRDLVSVGGHLVPFYPWPTMLLAAPADFLSALFGRSPASLSISDPSQVWLVEVPTASLIVAVTTVLLRKVVLGSDRPWATPKVALTVALVFAFASSAWSIASRALWQQTASMLFLVCALLAVQRLHRSWKYGAALGLFLGLAAISRPTDVVVVVLIGGWLLVTRRNRVVPAAAALLVVAAVFVAFSYTQYRAVLPPYYLASNLSGTVEYGFWESIGVNLISPSRGMVFFDPVLLFAGAGLWWMWRRRALTGFDVVLGLSFVGQLLVVSKYGSSGGSTYGPRLMIDVLPFLMVLSAPVLGLLFRPRTPGTPEPAHRGRVVPVLIVLVLAWSLFVNATGGLLRSAYCWSATPTPLSASPHRVWDWSDPQFFRPYRDLANGMSLHQVALGSCRTTQAS